MTASTRLPKQVLAGAAALLLAVLTGCSPPGPAGEPVSTKPAVAAPTEARTDVDAELEDLETRFDARLGLYAIDTGTGGEVAWREDERFAYASTIKAIAAADLLGRVGIDGLARKVPVHADDIVPHSPVTEERVGEEMSLAEITEAAVTQSDNTAANYMFEAIGGPQALDASLEDLGDEVTTVSRIEPELNEALPGDERDTTTPRAITGALHEYLLSDTLTDDEEALLTSWLTGTKTGDTLIRANLPADWTVGDKSGNGYYGSRGDIGVIWPTDGDPIVIAVMSSRDTKDATHDDRLIAEAAAIAVEALR